LIAASALSSCQYFYGNKEVTGVNNSNDTITYQFNYGKKLFTIGKDTLLPVGRWRDKNNKSHIQK
jgi:hypothetical protein